MKENKASFADFAVWSIDFDATNINNGDFWVMSIAVSFGVQQLQF